MYADQEQTAVDDPFKHVAKQFQHLKCGPNWSHSQLIDTQHLAKSDQAERLSDFDQIVDFNAITQLLQSRDKWEFYKLNQAPKGLLIVRNLFRTDYLKELYQKIMFNLPRNYADLLKSNESLCKLKSMPDSELIRSNLRWVTFGYHYDWTDKVYRRSDFNSTPDFLLELFQSLGSLFHAPDAIEAGIVNYYTCKSRLNPHSDNREENTSAPLFSLSLGQPAVFLLGSSTRHSKPVLPLVLRDGDLMIMGEESRLAFHSMSRLICDESSCDRKSIKRININARKVF